MRFFIKLNIISVLYGFLFFIITTILLNPFRFKELINISFKTIEISFFIILIFGALIFAFLIPLLTKKWLNGRIATLWSTILWFPYWLLFTFSFAYFFPNHNPYDDDNYAAAFVIFFLLFIYPLYLGLTTIFGFTEKNKKS